MTILLYKDGKLIVDAEQPLEGVSLDNLAAILSGASDGDVIQYDATNGMWVNKSAPSSLPEVTASDKGKYLKANESTGDPEWAADNSDLPDDPAQDGTYNLQNTVSSGTSTLSWASGGSSGGGVLVVNDTDGTLDKTAAEILTAYENGLVLIKASGEDEGTPYVDIGTLVDAHVSGSDYSFGIFMGNYAYYEASSGTAYPVMHQ